MAKEYAITHYYLPAHDGFDPTVQRLLSQLRAGRGAMIHRSDGVSLRVMADGGPEDPITPAIWEPRPSVNCWLCGASWPDGYAGFDHFGHTAAIVCHDCAANLAAMVLAAENAGEGGR